MENSELISKTMPSLSIIVEWENARNSDFQRGRTMLSALVDQLRNLSNAKPPAVELILVYDEDEGKAEDIMARLKDIVAEFPGAVIMAPCHGLDYYEQKNFGAQRAQYDAILLVDCDIIPCRGWLQNLLDCYIQEGADVVGGTTHLEKRSTYEKTFAAFWFFPLASEVGERATSPHFFANNVLFRAKVFKNMPFPECSLVRGKCVLLARKLLDNGYSIFTEPNAKVLHPPPNGLAHFVKRALCAGQDRVVAKANPGPRSAFGQFRQQVKVAVKRIISHRREVELGPLQLVGAVTIATVYIGLEFIGEMISFINLQFIRKNFRV